MVRITAATREGDASSNGGAHDLCIDRDPRLAATTLRVTTASD